MANRAPSIHNTQPWRFVLTGDALEIHADRTRQLQVLDPRGRQLTISCGSALYNATVAIAAAGYEPVVNRFPDPDRGDVVAEVRVGAWQGRTGARTLERAIDRRRTNRRAFSGDPVPAWLVNELQRAVEGDDGVLVSITEPEHRAAVTRLSVLAEGIERADPAYVTELAAWVTDDPRRSDGVQAANVPYAGEFAGRRDPLPIRRFDLQGTGRLPASSAGPDQTLLVLCSHGDQQDDWLRAGEALEHVLLKLTAHGFRASPLTQVVEVRETHHQLRVELGLSAEPQVLLRVGRALGTNVTPRRPAFEVIVDRTGSA